MRLTFHPLLLPVLGALLLPALAGCGTPYEVLGLERTPPNEYAVSTAPNLVVPPNYGLRAPGSGEPPPVTAGGGGLEALMSAPGAGALSAGEIALLEAAAATKADPNIRQTITEQLEGTAVENDLFIEDLLFWQNASDSAPASDPVIDPDAEAAAQGTGAPGN